jgi:hypothetical protein
VDFQTVEFSISLPNNKQVFDDNFHPACRHVSFTFWFRLRRVGIKQAEEVMRRVRGGRLADGIVAGEAFNQSASVAVPTVRCNCVTTVALR